MFVNVSGHGTVVKSPNKRCYNRDRVTLTAKASSGYKFGTWGGWCSSCGHNPTCTILMDRSKTCGAYFSRSIVNHAPNTPSTPSGNRYGYEYHSYTFATFATDPDAGDTLTYEYYWGDGHYSGWGSRVQSHTWTGMGWKCVKVRARDNHGAVSGWSGCHWIDIRYSHPAPSTPTVSGPTSGLIYRNYFFNASSSGATQYQFSWGDGYYSNWGSHYLGHMWRRTGRFCVKVRAKNAYNQYSSWSPCHYITIRMNNVNHPPRTPSAPSGPRSGYKYRNYKFTTSTTDPDGDPVTYQFNWDDGHYSGWGPSYSYHQWTTPGWKCVKVRAKDNRGSMSGWSGCHWIDIDYRTPPSSGGSSSTSGSAPSTPTISGPTSGRVYSIYSFHIVSLGATKYYVSWGDGYNSSGSSRSYAHDWTRAGRFCIKAKAENSYGTSSWSPCHTITISSSSSSNNSNNNTSGSAPSTPTISGPTSGYVGRNYSFTASASGATQYQFSWGNGAYTNWISSRTISHSWSVAGSYCVKAEAKNSYGTSSWSPCHTITINIPPPTVTGPTEGVTNHNYTFRAYAPGATNYEFNFGWLLGTWGSNSQPSFYTSPGTYCVKARAKDRNGHTSSWSSCHYIKISRHTTSNSSSNSNSNSYGSPPPAPYLSGTTRGWVRTNYSFTASASGATQYQFYWGDGTGYSSWGSGMRSHSWSSTGTYCVKARARNNYGAGNWSGCLSVTIKTNKQQAGGSSGGSSGGGSGGGNNRNNKPLPSGRTSVSGASSGCVGTTYAFTASAPGSTRYSFKWGDGGESSSSSSTQSHKWSRAGTYCVTAQGTGPGEKWYTWSQCHNITIKVCQSNTGSTTTHNTPPQLPVPYISGCYASVNFGGSSDQFTCYASVYQGEAKGVSEIEFSWDDWKGGGNGLWSTKWDQRTYYKTVRTSNIAMVIIHIDGVGSHCVKVRSGDGKGHYSNWSGCYKIYRGHDIGNGGGM